MTIVLILLAVVLFSGVKFYKDGYDGYISRGQTQAINGLFIILVFLRHFNQYVEMDGMLDAPFLYLDSHTGQLIVTTFMFYSGYGVMCSIMKKGREYVDSMPLCRIIRTLVLFDVAICLYIAMNLVLNIKMTISQIVLSFIGWQGVGNSTWYIFAILVMYLLTYLAFKISAKGDKAYVTGLIISTILIAAYVLLMRKFKDAQYYNTVLCYAMGLWYSYFKPKIDKLSSRYRGGYIAALALVILLFGVTAFFRNSNLIANQAYYLLFVAVIVLVSMKLKIDSPLLSWCGENLLGLYILQRIPMIALGRVEWMAHNIYVYFVLCALITVCMAYVYHRYVMAKIQTLFK